MPHKYQPRTGTPPVQFTARIPAPMHKKLIKRAKKRKCSLNAVLTEVLQLSKLLEDK